VGNLKNQNMRKLILILSLITLPIISFGQISEKEFVAKSSDLITFQFYNYPNFPINVSGTKELDKEWKGHKYENYFLIVYSYNQLYYKLKNYKIPWKEIAGMIDKLIHDYLGVDVTVVWKTIHQDIPTLEKLIGEIEK
jgi:hypothetical protein